MTPDPLRTVHISPSCSDLYDEAGAKVGTVQSVHGRTLLIAPSMQVTEDGLRLLLDAIVRCRVEHEWGS